jgi:hypothetical protein
MAQNAVQQAALRPHIEEVFRDKGEQDVRQKPWPGAPARNRVRRRRRLRDLLAAAAGELLAHVLDHLPLPRNHLQRLGDILAELVQGAAAAGAGCRGTDKRRARAADTQAVDDAPASCARSSSTRSWCARLRAVPPPRPRGARRSLTLRSAHSRYHQFVTRYPKASANSLPP